MKFAPVATLALLVCSFSAMSQTQVTDSLNSQLTGYWKLESVKFKGPVDINHDGKKSDDAVDEYNDCQKDQQIELLEDMTAKTYSGANAKDCKPAVEDYTWKVVKRTIRDAHYENGKRIVNDHVGLVLILKGKSESLQFLIVKVSKKSLKIKAELRDGTDSTSEAEVEYKKSKK